MPTARSYPSFAFPVSSLASRDTREHTSRGRRTMQAPLEKAAENVFQRLSSARHSVWGSVVPGIPDFCRELISAIAEG
jgi:hypothetical protein